MQKRPKNTPNTDENKTMVKFHEVNLPDEFPISHFYYLQKDKARTKLHFHNQFEIGICLENTGLFFVENKVLSYNKGDISFIYPDQPHIAQSYSQLPSKWVFITVDIMRLIGENALMLELERCKPYLPNIISSKETEEIKAILMLLITELEQAKIGYQEVVKSLLHSFCIMILRHSNMEREVTALKYKSSDYIAIAPALNFISLNFGQDITIDDLARCCNLSTTHFRRLFKATTNYAPLTYLTRVRLKMAKTILLSTTTPIAEIALGVGFGSISSFNRQFKEMYNTSPKQVRG